MTNDMTTGKPLKLLLAFSLPLLIGNIAQQLYSMADTIIVGRAIGVDALAAVGATGSLNFLLLGFVQGFTGGFSVITAQRFGAGDEKGVRKSFATGVILSFIIAIILTILTTVFARPLLELLKTPANIIEDSYSYIVVIFAGAFSMVFYNFLSGILRALGDSKTPLLFLIIASLLNIALDLGFIYLMGAGVEGAAWATVIAQLISGMLCLVYMYKKFPILQLRKADLHIELDFALLHLKLGIPMALQFSVISIGVMVIQSVLNSFGSTVVAGFTAASKIDQLAIQPILSFGIAMATYVAQNYGAGRIDRIREGVRKSIMVVLIVSIALSITIQNIGKPLTALFVGESEQLVLDSSQTYLSITSMFYFVLGLLFIFRNTLQGIGNVIVPLISGVLEVVVRIIASFVLVDFLQYQGLCMAGPSAWVAGALLLAVTYVIQIRRLPISTPALHERE